MKRKKKTRVSYLRLVRLPETVNTASELPAIRAPHVRSDPRARKVQGVEHCQRHRSRCPSRNQGQAQIPPEILDRNASEEQRAKPVVVVVVIGGGGSGGGGGV